MIGLILARKNFSRLLYLFDLATGNKPKVFVLCYHSISSDWQYGVSLSNFEKQISFLKNYYNFITPAQLDNYLNKKLDLVFPSVLLTFDDGYQDVLKTKSFLKKSKIQPLIFILSDPKNADRRQLATRKKLLTDRQIMGLKKTGWEIGSHGQTHPDYWTLTKNQIQLEIKISKQALTKKFGKIRYFAYPKGRFTPASLAGVSKAGYNLAFSMNDGFIDQNSNQFLIPRIGINQTHDFKEFTSLFSPSVIQFRRFCKSFKLERIFV